MTNLGQSLGKVAVSQVSARRRGLVQEGGHIGAGLYAALAMHDVVVESAASIDEVLSMLGKDTRLIVLNVNTDDDQIRRTTRRVRHTDYGWSIVIIVLADAFADRALATRRQQKWRIDLCLPTGAPKKLLAERLGPALRKRQPISEIPDLPKPVSTALDELWGSLERGSYYALLQVDKEAAEPEIRAAFKNLAQIAHPDRHRMRMKHYPACVERITNVYKRLSEAHGILTHPIRRRLYDLCLKSGQTVRYEPEKLDSSFRNEVDLCATDEAKMAVLESINSRLGGDWRAAARYMEIAIQAEPSNPGLKTRTDSVKRVCLVAAPIEMSIESNGGYV